MQTIPLKRPNLTCIIPAWMGCSSKLLPNRFVQTQENHTQKQLLYRERTAKDVDVWRSTINRLTTNKNTDTNHHITEIGIIHLQAEPTGLTHTHTSNGNNK